jgi:hypothetical protein
LDTNSNFFSNLFYYKRVCLLVSIVLIERKNSSRKKMSFSNHNPSENQPLLDEHIETGQEPRRTCAKYNYYNIAVIICLCIGAAIGIGIYTSNEGTYVLKPVCCKKRPKIAPNQLMVWGIRAL